MKHGILALCIASAIAVSAQESTKITATKFNDFGLTYSLPRTNIDVEVTATKVTAKAGPYYQYAEKYLGAPATITEDAVYWELDGVKLKTTGVPNKNEQYFAQFKSGTAPFIYLNKEGIILAINTEPIIDATSLTEAQKSAKNSAGNNTQSVLSEELLMSGSVAKMAEVAAKQIYRIRESRVDLVTGNVDKLPPDGESFKLVMQQLDDQELALVALFMGTEQKEKINRSLSIQPEGELSNDILFRFSKHLGILPKDDLGGIPVYLNVQIVEKGEYPVDNKGRQKEAPKGGIAYNIPGKANIDIRFAGKTLASTTAQIAQFGVVYALTPEMFDNKKTPNKVVFYPETGAIREIGQVQ